jgi:hypothetical protein
MRTVKHKIRLSNLLILFLLLAYLTGCGTAFVASKQDDILTQIDVWSAENEYAKAFSTLGYVKQSHPQYKALQLRKSKLLVQASEYEQQVDTQVKSYIREKQWAKALDLIDEAKIKYPHSDKDDKRLLGYTEKYFNEKQEKALVVIEKKILLAKTQWMIAARPIYKEKLNTEPRNEELKKQWAELQKESQQMAQELTLLSLQAIERKHYQTAKLRINQAIELEKNEERKNILSKLKNRSKANYKKRQKTDKRKRKIKQTTILDDIENSYRAGEYLKAKQLIQSLEATKEESIHLKQLEQELERSIQYTVERLMSQANKHYTNGNFQLAIRLWEQALIYDPDNVLAKKNIQRAEKVIEKLSTLREKQKN